MKLIQISDCHLFATPETVGYGNVKPAASLARVLVAAASHQPDGILFTGDISGDDSALSYHLFMQLIADNAPDIPWRVIPGNHDLNPFFDKLLKARWLTPDAPWHHNNAVIHGIDTRFEGTLGMIRPAELDRVASEIAARTDAIHLLALHHHPVATESWMDKHALHNIPFLTQWLLENPLAAVLHGHIHADTRTELSNTPVLGVPSSSWQWQLTTDFGIAEVPAGYRLIECHNHSVTTQVYRVEN